MKAVRWKAVAETVTTPMDASGKGQEARVNKPFHVELLELTWQSGIDVARDKAVIDEPHWQKAKSGEYIEESNDKVQHYRSGSTHPGVYLLKGKGSNKLRVKVKVTNDNGLKGDYLLRGWLGGTGELILEGKCPLKGEETIDLEIKNLPDSLQHYEGDSKWKVMEAGSGKVIHTINDRPRLEVFVVYDKPQTFYKEGVWVEALRLMFKRAGLTGFRREESISAHVARYCHTRHLMRYDTVRGASWFGMDGLGGVFKLMEYIQRESSKVQEVKEEIVLIDQLISRFPPDSVEVELLEAKRYSAMEVTPNTVNCYDQAAAVQAFCGAMGVDVQWVFQYPFGYIKETNLVGVGKCNNPFYKGNGTTPVVANDDPRRTSFDNHAFVETASSGKNIRDACAGPYTESNGLRKYLEAVIDVDASFIKSGSGLVPTDANRKSEFDSLEKATSRKPGVSNVE
jgi:hypothetical protein